MANRDVEANGWYNPYKLGTKLLSLCKTCQQFVQNFVLVLKRQNLFFVICECIRSFKALLKMLCMTSFIGGEQFKFQEPRGTIRNI
jgi:hypothetical protein